MSDFLFLKKKPKKFLNINKKPGQSKKTFISSVPEQVIADIPAISAQSAIIIDASSQKMLYTKNSNLRFSQASTVKLMTALVAIENFNVNDAITIFSPRIAGSNMGFVTGEQFRLRDLLYTML